MGKLQEIELFIRDEEDGAFAISLVESPAIQEKWVALSKHEMKLQVVNEEKRIVVGMALVPEKRIYRRMKDKEFNIYFSKETVQQTAELYMKRLHLNNVTVEHEREIEGASVIESWIVEDTKNDKSNMYNLNAPEGAWIVKMKIYNDEEWSKVKEGKYQGFSIEGLFEGFDQLMQKQKTDAEILVDKLKDIINGNA